eukprot:m.752 g.752  ORF g.752 m.752 type:complete len:1201 (+) comp4785_c0_seq2:172-3774(+)
MSVFSVRAFVLFSLGLYFPTAVGVEMRISWAGFQVHGMTVLQDSGSLFETYKLTVPIGTNVTFYCHPPDVAEYYRDTPDASNVFQPSSSAGYNFAAKFPDDNRVYGCLGFGGVVQKRLDLTVTVLSPVNGSGFLQVLRADWGQQVSMTFSVLSNPYPRFRWSYHDRNVNSSDGRYRENTPAHNQTVFASTLQIRSVSFNTYGNYSCSANNTIESASSHFEVQPSVLPSANAILGATINVKGQSFNLSCNTSGSPSPLVFWTKDGQPVRSRPSEISVNMTTGFLQVLQVYLNSSGIYTCIAKTGPYTSKSQPLHVMIIDVPRMAKNVKVVGIGVREAGVTFQVNRNSTVYSVERSQVLYQKVNDSQWKIGWNGPGNKSLANLTGLEPFSDYQIQVSSWNKAGWSQPSNLVTFTTDSDVPDAVPLNVSASALNSTAVEFSWQDLLKTNWLAPERGYIIQFWKTANASSAVKVTAVQSSADQQNAIVALISSLKKFTNYSAVVAAFNLKGRGNWSRVVRVQTEEDVPDVAPSSIALKSNGSTWIFIEWRKLTEGINGILVGYHISIAPKKNQTSSKIYASSQRETQYNLTGLSPYTQYLVRTAGVTRKGVGLWSQLQVFWTDEDVSGLCAALQGNDTRVGVLIRWSRPSRPNGIILKYVVEYRLADNGSWASKDVRFNQYQYIVSRLTPETLYEFTVSAFNSKGKGAASTVRVKTLHFLPTTGYPTLPPSSETPSSEPASTTKYSVGTVTAAFHSTGNASGNATTSSESAGLSYDQILFISVGCALSIPIALVIGMFIYCCVRKRRDKGKYDFDNSDVISNKNARFSMNQIAMQRMDSAVRKPRVKNSNGFFSRAGTVIANPSAAKSDGESPKEKVSSTEQTKISGSKDTPVLKSSPPPDIVQYALVGDPVSVRRATTPSRQNSHDSIDYALPQGSTLPREKGKQMSRKVVHDASVDNKQALAKGNNVIVKKLPKSIKDKKKKRRGDYEDPSDAVGKPGDAADGYAMPSDVATAQNKSEASPPPNGCYEEVDLSKRKSIFPFLKKKSKSQFGMKEKKKEKQDFEKREKSRSLQMPVNAEDQRNGYETVESPNRQYEALTFSSAAEESRPYERLSLKAKPPQSPHYAEIVKDSNYGEVPPDDQQREKNKKGYVYSQVNLMPISLRDDQREAVEKKFSQSSMAGHVPESPVSEDGNGEIYRPEYD